MCLGIVPIAYLWYLHENMSVRKLTLIFVCTEHTFERVHTHRRILL